MAREKLNLFLDVFFSIENSIKNRNFNDCEKYLILVMPHPYHLLFQQPHLPPHLHPV